MEMARSLSGGGGTSDSDSNLFTECCFQIKRETSKDTLLTKIYNFLFTPSV